ncbi:hypothetical protein [Herbidospora daliensis]|uniref:hypothetical protein n=1 Tax=Herbidospora daliensis TaxID=295585 RepID=UPI000781393F|nr:hypothetical protein [Herbidospora daliensis]
MNDVISRLKDATTAAGDTISTVPPLRLEKARKGFLAPLAAALAVGLAIVGSVVMTRGGLGQTASTTVAPRFIVQVKDEYALIVRGAGDGAELDRIEGTAGWFYNQVQAAPDNRTFYASQSGPVLCSSRIVRFSVDDQGRAGPLSEVPVRRPDRTRISAFAVSGDGTKIVLGAVPCVTDGDGTGFLVVADTGSGKDRRFRVAARTGFAAISTSDDGSKIAYTTMAVDHQVAVSEPTVIVAPPSDISTPLPSPPTHEPAAVMSVAPVTPTPLPNPRPTDGPAAVWPSPSVPLTPVPSAPPPSGAPERPMVVSVPTHTVSDRGPSGNVVVVVPSPGPMPSGNFDVYPAPTSVPPSLGTLKGVGSCRFFEVREVLENGELAPNQLRALDCADSPEIYVLDTDESADPRRVVLSGELDGTRVQFYGVRMSSDGTRLIAGVGTGMTTLGDPRAAVMAFDPDGREPAEVLYRGRAWLRVLDLAPGGGRILVQSELEIGEVSENAYRKVMDIPGRVMDGVVAW